MSFDAPAKNLYGSPQRTIRVCAPVAHAGIGDALRRAFTAPLSNPLDNELMRMLEKV